MSVWEAIPRISRWLLCIRARVHPSIQTQTTPFQWRGVVSNTDSKCPYPKQELYNCWIAVNCQGETQRSNTLFSRPGCSGPTHFQSASMQHFPLRSSGRRILNYLDDWLILARSLDTLISHIDSLLIHLESLRLCLNMQRASSPPPLARSRGGWEPASREIAWRWNPASREIEPRPIVFPAPFSGKAALFSWRYFRDCSDSRWRIQRYYIRDYYTCARCSYGWNLESREQRGLRDVCVSRPHRSSDATQISSAGEFPCAW